MVRLERKAFSMVEILMGIGIFGLAILPLVWLGHNQSKGAYSVGKHMMAGQLASSLMDETLKTPYKDITSKAVSKSRVLDSDKCHLLDAIQTLDDETAEKDVMVLFRNFKFKIDVSNSESDKIARVDVEVFYRVVEGDESGKSEQSVRLSALKFGDKNE